MRILAIETSCDETSIAFIKGDAALNDRILYHRVFSQDHNDYGGVVPELAARQHMQTLPILLKKFFKDVERRDIDAVSATVGPGLMGGLLVGMTTAKGIALSLGVSFFPVHHLEGHILSVRLSENIPFPYLLLLASGGHCQIVEVCSVGDYKILGQTLDDAAGEAFDKVAQLLRLPYPGGPAIEKEALKGNPFRFPFSIPMKTSPSANLSFSGLKTAVRTSWLTSEKTSQDISDLAASFQRIVVESFLVALDKAYVQSSAKTLVVAGGVGANAFLRQALQTWAIKKGLDFSSPPQHLCTDNGAMIGWAAYERWKAGGYQEKNDTAEARPRWNYDELKISPNLC